MEPKLILAAVGTEEGLILLHQVLVHLGHTVVLASSGEEAIEQAARHRPDAVLLDLQMDDGDPLPTLRSLATDGWAAITPIIGLTGAQESPATRDRLAAVIHKPIVLASLGSTIERCLSTDGSALAQVA